MYALSLADRTRARGDVSGEERMSARIRGSDPEARYIVGVMFRLLALRIQPRVLREWLDWQGCVETVGIASDPRRIAFRIAAELCAFCRGTALKTGTLEVKTIGPAHPVGFTRYSPSAKAVVSTMPIWEHSVTVANGRVFEQSCLADKVLTAAYHLAGVPGFSHETLAR